MTASKTLLGTLLGTLLLTGGAFASDSVQLAQASTEPTRAEVRAEGKANPPAAGVANAQPGATAASSPSRAEVRADARKNKPAAGIQSDVGSSAVKSQGSRAQVRAQTRKAVKAGNAPKAGETTN